MKGDLNLCFFNNDPVPTPATAAPFQALGAPQLQIGTRTRTRRQRPALTLSNFNNTNTNPLTLVSNNNAANALNGV